MFTVYHPPLFSELLKTEASMDPQPKAVLIKEIYDVRSWIATNLNELHGHSQPHCYKFALNRDGKAVMFTNGVLKRMHQ